MYSFFLPIPALLFHHLQLPVNFYLHLHLDCCSLVNICAIYFLSFHFAFLITVLSILYCILVLYQLDLLPLAIFMDHLANKSRVLIGNHGRTFELAFISYNLKEHVPLTGELRRG